MIIDLKKTLGLPILLDGENLVFQDLTRQNELKYGVDDVRPQLLNQEITSPEVFYTKHFEVDHNDIFTSKSLRVNIYHVPANIAGIEYVKTKAHSSETHPHILEIVNGSGVLILQRCDSDDDYDIIISKITKNQKAIIPPGYAASVSNTRQTPLVLAELSSVDSQTSHVLDDMQGMAYYLIKKNAKQEIVRNPMYRGEKLYRKVNWDDIVVKHNITLKTPLVKQIMRKYDKFKWLFEEKSFSL